MQIGVVDYRNNIDKAMKEARKLKNRKFKDEKGQLRNVSCKISKC